MGPGPAHGPGAAVYLIPLLFIGLAVLRGARARNLRIERLWITPAILLIITVMTLSQQRLPPPAMIGIDLAALAGGGALGWWRGRFTRITVDPEKHTLTSQTSPVGMLLLVAIFALRFGLRSYVFENAGALHLSVTAATDAFLLLAVGLICAQRLEIALRASRLLTSARASRVP